MEQGGGEKRGRAWAAGGRGLQPPGAAAVTEQSALSAPLSDSGAYCAGTRAPTGGRPSSWAPGLRKRRRKAARAVELFLEAGGLVAVRCSACPKD